MAEDSRIALAALAVTAIVGVGAPFVTVVATNNHDSARLHAEQAQADRTELRGVLDDASGVLYIARARFHNLTPGGGRDPSARLEQQLDQIAQHSNRVAIRLGRSAAAAASMRRALTAGEAVQDGFARFDEALRAPASLDERSHLASAFADAVQRYDDDVDHFVDAAHRFVAATLA